jgi:thiosulfate dehydrogenase
LLLLAGALAGSAGWACGEEEVPAATFGERLFRDPHLSTSPFNVFSCATCHQAIAEPVSPPPLDAGFNLYNVVHRPSWWGGFETRLVDAINVCLTSFMGGGALDPAAPSARQLYEYLAAKSPLDPAPALPLTVVKIITDLPALTGDAARGADVYGRACRRCHGEPHTGAGRLATWVSVVPEDTINFFPQNARAVVVEKIRHGRFFDIGGVMPLYPVESISDEQIADLLAYIGL